jgi:hypothetical protein
MKLLDLAHTRSGDKGDICNISVIAFQLSDYEFIKTHLTAERVHHHFSNLVAGKVERFELPQLGALNFVLHDALSGGVNRSLALDAHGKCLGSILLEIDMPEKSG